ncbi:hypothetical protein KIF24_25615 [Micromonospora sp. Llam7]|uniref:hypothetical protein n=1 Tax=Micromonospora tarapacensis TaxID=2835305 RepID=UPI001C8374AF|nr:hypothetical protein [Micromonospora tarapacensis]MBX7269070.1 hypothetical protein [Micromonospora tarapacensis]
MRKPPPLVRYLAEAGVLDDARTQEEFDSSGLLDSGSTSHTVADGAPLLHIPREFS